MNTAHRTWLAAVFLFALMTLNAASAKPAPQRPATIASVAVGLDKAIAVELSDGRHLRTTDGGVTWRSDPQYQLAWDRYDHGIELQLTRKADFPALIASGLPPAPGPQTLLGTTRYACVAQQLYFSKNAGKNWQLMQLPMSSFHCNALIADGKYLYVGNSGGILRKADHEQQWTVLSGPGPKLTERLLKDQHGNIYANVRDSAARCSSYRSEDQGNTWTHIVFPAEHGANNTCAVVGAAGATLFGRSGAGLFSSTSQGAEWSDAGAGLAHAAQQPVVIEQVLDGGDGALLAYSRDALFTRANAAAAWRRLPLPMSKRP